MLAGLKALLYAVALVLLFCLLPGAVAQTTQVTECTATQFNFTVNSLGQNPCLVASYLQGACNGGEFDVAALPQGDHYVGPTAGAEANECTCNIVTYNLMSACGACQNLTIETWSSWYTNCSLLYFTYPDVPPATAVPGWAYLNATNDLWNPVAAFEDRNATESTATVQKPTGSITSSSSSSSTAGGGPSGTSSPQSVVAATHKTEVGAIAGGVIGGVVGLALIGGLIAFIFMRSRRTSKATSALFDLRPMSQAGTHYESTPFSPNSATKFYDPADPNTFPPTIGSPTSHSSNSGYPASVPGQLSPSRPGQYNGVPEL